jgi:hypothetical protein
MKQEDGIPKKFRIHPTTQIEVTVTKGFYTLKDVLEGKWDGEDDFSFNQAAEDLIDSFNEHDCIAFLEALHKVTAKRIVEHWRDCSPERLEEEQYKKYLDYE